MDIVLVNQDCKNKTFSLYISSESTVFIKQKNETKIFLEYITNSRLYRIMDNGEV